MRGKFEVLNDNEVKVTHPNYPDVEIVMRGPSATAAKAAFDFLFGTPFDTERAKAPLRPWAQEELDLLGTMKDADLAKQIDRTPEQIAAQRHYRKIPNFTGIAAGKPMKRAAKQSASKDQ